MGLREKLDLILAMPGISRQAIHEEALIGAEVGDDDAQQIVGVAGHEIALHHLGPGAQRAFENFERAFDLAFQCDVDEHVDTKAECRRVHGGDIAGDDAALFQLAGPPQARRLRQADGFRELDIGLTRMRLQLVKDSQVYRIKG